MTGKRIRKAQGGTLVVVTTIGVIVSILALAMIQLGYHSRMMSIRNVQSISARCAADAGMAEAIFKMQKKLVDEKVWDGTTLPSAEKTVLLQTPAHFAYKIVRNAGGNFVIVSAGTSGTAQRRTYVVLTLDSFWRGIAVRETIDVKLGAKLGVIGPGKSRDFKLRTNSTKADSVKLKAFVTVPGDVVIGPGGDTDVVIDTKATTIIQGETYAASELLEFPDVQVPDNMVYSGSITADNTVIPTPGRYQYDTIDLPQNGILRITAPVTLYVTGKMVLGQSAEVIIEPSGSLELYLGTSLEDKNSTGISNETNTAVDLQIYGLPTCTDIDLKAKSDLYASVYAPEASVDLFNNGDFYGALVGYDFTMNNSGNFFFDTNLMNVSIDDQVATFVVGRWWED